MKSQILCHEIEQNPSKDRAINEGDNPSFWDEFIEFYFVLYSLKNVNLVEWEI
jgi:hypothetical protein